MLSSNFLNLLTAPQHKALRGFATIAFAAAINVFGVAFAVGFCAFEGQNSLVAALFYTSVAVEFFVENKALALGFVLPKIWNVCVDMMRLAILQTLATAVTRIGQNLFHFQAVFFEICDGLVHDFAKWHCLCADAGASSVMTWCASSTELPRIV